MAVALWLLCACIACIIGSKKGEAFLGLFFGLLLGPLGVLIVIASKGNRLQCPACKEWIHKGARKCPHCATDLSDERRVSLRRRIGPGTIAIVLSLSVLLFWAILHAPSDDTTNSTLVSTPSQVQPSIADGRSAPPLPSQPLPVGQVEQPLTAGCTPSEINQCCGYINKTGAWVIKPQFTDCYPFSEGFAPVQEGKQWGYVDKAGKLVVTLPADAGWAPGFSDGLAAVEANGKCGFVDHFGRYAIQPVFVGCNSFSDGVAAVAEVGPKIGFIDKTGHFVIPPVFTTFGDFSDGKAPVSETTGLRPALVGFINMNGKYVITPQFAFAASFSNGMALVQDGSGRFGYINEAGQMVISPQFKEGSSFSEGLAAVEQDGKWGYIDKAGTFAIAPKFEYGYPFSEGLAGVNIGGEFGFIDKTGKVVIRPQFGVGVGGPKFAEGLAPVDIHVPQQ